MPLSAQVGVPVEQLSVPVWHGFAGVQGEFGGQSVAQLPFEQTMFVPHIVPFGRLPDSLQTGAPVAHVTTPVLQAFGGWQLEPAAHDTHVPALQTLSVPHEAPVASTLPVSVHAMLGAQTVMPAWHGFAGTQAAPAEQAAQFPPWQTMFAPQTVPGATSPDSMQTSVPVLHAIVPLRHGLPGTTQSMP